MLPTDRYPPPSWQDWGLLGIGVVFCACGLLIFGERPEVGIMTLLLFGGCTVVFARIILRRYRYRRYRASVAEVQGGVRIPPARTRFVLMALWMIALGVAAHAYARGYGAIFQWLCYGVGVAGAVLLLGVISGRVPAMSFLQFDPAGLTVGYRRWTLMLPWDDIVNVAEAEMSSNPVVLLWLNDAQALQVDPPGKRASAWRMLASKSAWTGADITIMASQYAIDLPLLVDAISRYVREPDSRAALARRGLPPAVT